MFLSGCGGACFLLAFLVGCVLGGGSGCRVGFDGLFLWCAGVLLSFLCLLYVFLYMFLLCVYWWVVGFACVGVFWGYGCGVLFFVFWRFLCLLVVVFCRVLVL